MWAPSKWGVLLCQTYEACLELHTQVSISFEHAWFLLLALARRDEVGVARCEECGPKFGSARRVTGLEVDVSGEYEVVLNGGHKLRPSGRFRKDFMARVNASPMRTTGN